MAEVQGVVDRITSKQTQGGKTVYNFQLNGEWYGMGFNQPNFGQGAEIEFDIEWNGNYANVAKGSLNILSPGQGRGNQGGGQRNGGGGYGGGQRQGGQQRSSGGYNQGGGQRSSGGGGAPAGNNAKDAYWEKKEKTDKLTQRAIQHQSARNSAIAFLEVAVTAGAVKLPAKQAEQYDALLGLLDAVQEKFLNDTRDYALAGVKAPQAQRQAPPPQPEPEPEPEPEPQNYGGGEPPEDFDDDIPF